ncbi:sororin [Chanos chanos]|uniref:Sororin n=1 Tax=Chanos chanos TaxID=29144 RepID=A0A6J2WWU8_CHACN|nr:sororin [Chanos chanos]
MSNRTPKLDSSGQSAKKRGENKKPDEPTPSRRRSARLSGNEQTSKPSLIQVVPVVAKRSTITVRKIAPRKTQVPSQENKENVERPSDVTAKRSKTFSPPPAPLSKPPKVLSPILPPRSPPAQSQDESQDALWSQKVRRSYSRLSAGDASFESPKHLASSSPSPSHRETLFGFEKLLTPEVNRKANLSRGAPQASSSLCGGSFNASAADENSACAEPDPNIPGVALSKKNLRRKRVQQIKMSEFDVLAAKMNAEFQEAESFELVVE